jgi:hypothetical protein
MRLVSIWQIVVGHKDGLKAHGCGSENGGEAPSERVSLFNSCRRVFFDEYVGTYQFRWACALRTIA